MPNSEIHMAGESSAAQGAENEIFLPEGLVGFPELKHMEILIDERELPFMWLNSVEEGGLSFIIAEPAQILPDYEARISEADAEALELSSQEDAFILNIVTVAPGPPRRITINLPGPIVINRHTRKGRQVVLLNYEDYSARHLLYEEAAEGAEGGAATC
jgi:flagellar assembly factor FliW